MDRVKKTLDLAGNATVMSKLSGISTRSLSAYANGKSDPSRGRLIAIATAANVTIEWLATGKGPMRPREGPRPAEDEVAPGQNQEQPVAAPIDYASFRISEKMQKTIEILESETIYRPALAANIDAFHHGMLQEQVVQDQAGRINNLESRMAALEKSMASATVAPDDHCLQSEKKAM